MINWVLLGMLLAIMGIDLYFELSDRVTISEWYQSLFPTWIDIYLLALTMAFIRLGHFHITLKIVLAVIAGHVFWPNKERYKW